MCFLFAGITATRRRVCVKRARANIWSDRHVRNRTEHWHTFAGICQRKSLQTLKELISTIGTQHIEQAITKRTKLQGVKPENVTRSKASDSPRRVHGNLLRFEPIHGINAENLSSDRGQAYDYENSCERHPATNHPARHTKMYAAMNIASEK